MSNSKYAPYFKLAGDWAFCNKCKARLSYKDSSPKSLKKHLESQHKDLWKELQEKEASVSQKREADKQQMCTSMKMFVIAKDGSPSAVPASSASSEQSSQPSQPTQQSVKAVYGNWSPQGLCTKQANRALAQLVACANLPLSIVEHPAFVNFCSVLQPLYKPPCRWSLTNTHIDQLCSEYQDKVKADLKEATHISLTSDVATTKNMKQSLVSMTTHFLDADLQPRHCYAAVQSIRVLHHTGLAIGSILDDCMRFYNIESKIHVLLRDAGSNMIAAAQILDITSLDCFAHKVQNAVKDGMKMCGSMVGEGGTIEKVKTVIRKLRKSCVEAGKFKELQEEAMLPQIQLEKGVDVRWNTVHNMLKCFCDQRPAIEALINSSRDYPAITSDEWANMKQLEHALEAATEMLNGPGSPEPTDDADAESAEPICPLMQLIALAAEAEQEGSSNAHAKKRRPSGAVSALEKANVEVETYVSSKTITKGPFQYWRDEKEKFPVLFKLAQRFLSAPSTSAESERLFSTGTAIYTALRRSMSADTFQKLLFLSRNIPIYGF